MKVKITDPAKDQLRRIYHYHRRSGNGKKGRQIRKNVLEKARLLKDFPEMGQEEDNLKHLGLGHRYIPIKPFYKIIYLIIKPIIYITDIFDTRQDPDKMKP